MDIADQATATTDSEAEATRVARDGGVGLIACAEDGDVVVSLHGDEGVELRRYLVDILPAPTPDPNVAPRFHTAAAFRCAADQNGIVLPPGTDVPPVIRVHDPDQEGALDYQLASEGAIFFTVRSAHVADDPLTLGDEERFQAQLAVGDGVLLLPETVYRLSLVATDSQGATGTVYLTISTAGGCTAEG